MNLRRRVIGLAGAALLLAWLAAAFTSGRTESPVEQSPPVAHRPDRSIDELLTQTARLHEQLTPDKAPRHPSRNLFRFAPPPPTPMPAPSTTMPTEAVPPPSAPALSLAGIAEDITPEGPVRTAVISSRGQLFLVKEGEEVASRYRVTQISVEAAELTDLMTGSTLWLALK